MATAAAATATAAAPPQRARPAPARGPDTPPRRASPLASVRHGALLIGWRGCRSDPGRAVEVGLPSGAAYEGLDGWWSRGWPPMATEGSSWDRAYGGLLKKVVEEPRSLSSACCVPAPVFLAAVAVTALQGRNGQRARATGTGPRFESQSRRFRTTCGLTGADVTSLGLSFLIWCGEEERHGTWSEFQQC